MLRVLRMGGETRRPRTVLNPLHCDTHSLAGVWSRPQHRRGRRRGLAQRCPTELWVRQSCGSDMLQQPRKSQNEQVDLVVMGWYLTQRIRGLASSPRSQHGKASVRFYILGTESSKRSACLTPRAQLELNDIPGSTAAGLLAALGDGQRISELQGPLWNHVAVLKAGSDPCTFASC